MHNTYTLTMATTELGQLIQSYDVNKTGLLKSFQTRYPDLNNRATRISQFKREVLAAKPGILNFDHVKDWKEYNQFSKLSQPEQYRAWKEATKEDDPSKWQEALAEKNPLPQNLQDLHLTRAEMKERKSSLAKDQKKLDDDSHDIDGAAMINKLSCLESEHKWDVVAGLLLATGRRCSEVLKFGDFKAVGPEELSMGGQLKSGLTDKERYQFPVLAPSDFILKRLEYVRRAIKTDNLSTAELNQAYTSVINKHVKKLFDVNPHRLRAIYANMAYAGFAPKNANEVRYISEILGHDGTKNAGFYKRIHIENYDGQIYHPSLTAKEGKLPGPELIWSPTNASDAKKVAAIKAVVKAGEPLTIKAVREAGGGDARAISAFLARNKDFVDWYNQHT